MTLSAGEKLGPYEILSPLGAGGMGEVYRARDTRLGREVAVKVLPESLAADPERLARFEREAKLLASLNHPSIAAIYGAETAAGTPALVMELAPGPTLAEHVARGGLPLDEALPIGRHIAEGIEYAHEHGVIHRDLKPANVKVADDGTVKILDFGLAKALGDEVSPGDLTMSPTLTGLATQAGMILGTAAYMSPEQAKGKRVDRRADIWAFGCLLFEMLSGSRCFAGETVTDVLASVLKEDPDWSRLPADTPQAIRRLLERCLTKDPRERLQAIGEARIALEDGAAHEYEQPAAAAPARPSRWRLWFDLACVAAVVLLAAGYLAGRGHPASAGSGSFIFQQKTFRRQTIFTARFAPDGKTLVYSAADQGSVPQLFVVRPEYPEPQPLGLKDTQLLSISRTGELAVLSHAHWLDHRLFDGTLGRVPLGGGAPRDLMDHVREADWSPDGAQLAVIHDVAGRDKLEFPIGTVLYESSGYLSDPRVSPQGDRIAFFEHPSRFDDRGSVAVVDRSGKRTVLSSGYWGEEGLAWLPGGGDLLFSAVDRGGIFHMTRVDMAGHTRPVLPTPGSVTVQDVSREGNWLFTRDDLSTQIMVRPPGESEARDFSWLDLSLRPALSHDGRLMTVDDEASTGGVNYTVLLRKTDGSPFVRLGDGEGTAFSPDRRWLSVIVPVTPQKLMLYPTGAGEPRRVDHGQIEAYSGAGWSPDGRSLLVSGSEPGKAPRCYLMPLEGGNLRPVTPEGTDEGLMSPDSRLVSARTIGGGYRIYPMDGGQSRDLPAVTPDDNVIRWSPDGTALWVYSAAGFPVRIDSVELSTGRRSPLETIDLQDSSGVLSVLTVSLADDPHVYAYVVWHYVSHLFVAETTR
jgi:eukaryotic-like serine/threonine-protein kinase